MMISLAEPSGSPPTLRTQLCLICQCRVGDAAGEKQTEWEPSATWQNKATATALQSILAVGEGRPQTPVASWHLPSSSKGYKGLGGQHKKGQWKFLKFHCESHLTLQPPGRRDHLHPLKPGLTLALQQIAVSTFPQLQYLLTDSHVGRLPGPQPQPPQIMPQGPTAFLLHLQCPLWHALNSTAS